MNDSANHALAPTIRDGSNDPEQIEEEKIFFNEVSDEQLEAVASGPMVTLTYRLFSLLVSFAETSAQFAELMRSYHSVILKGFYHSMENESAAHGGDKKADNAGNRIDS